MREVKIYMTTAAGRTTILLWPGSLIIFKNDKF